MRRPLVSLPITTHQEGVCYTDITSPLHLIVMVVATWNAYYLLVGTQKGCLGRQAAARQGIYLCLEGLQQWSYLVPQLL